MVTVQEWAPLWALPVVPVPSRRLCYRAIAAAFPGDVSRFAMRFIAPLRAAVLIPAIPGAPWESGLPVPIFALARHTTRQGRKDQIFHFPTATGFDCYRFAEGILQEIWTTQTPPETSREIVIPAREHKRLVAPPARPKLRQQLSSVAGIIVPLCLVLIGVFLPMPSGAAQNVAQDQIKQGSLTSVYRTIDLNETFSVMKQLASALPDAQLYLLRVNTQQSELNLRTSQSVSTVVSALTQLEQAGRHISWTIHRESNQTIAIQMEVIHE